MRKQVCVIIPTYNNAQTLLGVIEEVKSYTEHIIVVNDGSTDDTAHLLETCPIPLILVTHTRNRGKGAALRSGFQAAIQHGFDYAITIDSDGQHYPSDLPRFLAAIRKNPNAIIVGNRFDPSFFTEKSRQNMNGGSKFANRFSNFWFRLQTGMCLDDTQTGYRAYPLNRLRGLSFLTSRYEAELELLVFAAWSGVKLVSIPIRVHYPSPEERVSHFRPTLDFLRITLLNTVLCFLAVVFAWPFRLLKVLLTVGVLLLLFVLMFFIQIGMLIYFNSHRVTEGERLAYHGCIQAISRWLLRHIPGVQSTLLNPEKEDFTPPGIIISNHQSHFDLLCIMLLTPRLVILTKRWVWLNPLYGVAIRYAEFLPVTHDLERNEVQLAALVKRGYNVMIFPEGTRSASLDVLRFHQGAFYLARKYNLDIIPVFLYGTGHVLNKRARTVSPGQIVIDVKPRMSVQDAAYGTTSVAMARYFRSLYREWAAEYDAKIQL